MTTFRSLCIHKAVAALAALTLAFALPAGRAMAASTFEAHYTTASVTSQEQIAGNLLNLDRSNYNLPGLTIVPALSRIARLKSEDMRDNQYFAHTSPTYGDVRSMLTKMGYAYTVAGENIAHHATIEKAQAALISSPGHPAQYFKHGLYQGRHRRGAGSKRLCLSDPDFLPLIVSAFQPLPHGFRLFQRSARRAFARGQHGGLQRLKRGPENDVPGIPSGLRFAFHTKSLPHHRMRRGIFCVNEHRQSACAKRAAAECMTEGFLISPSAPASADPAPLLLSLHRA